MRGNPQELEDFIQCILAGREPISGLDLAENTLKVDLMLAIFSAEKGQRNSDLGPSRRPGRPRMPHPVIRRLYVFLLLPGGLTFFSFVFTIFGGFLPAVGFLTEEVISHRNRHRPP